MTSRGWLGRWWPGLIAVPFLVAPAKAQSLRVTDVRLGSQRDLQFTYASDTNSYYLLHQGSSVTSISAPVQIRLGTNGEARFVVSATAAAGFYRLRRVPLTQPLDTDGDGLDDVHELLNPQLYDPLDPTDGRLTRVSSTSPANGETDVAVTRETVVTFSLPLAAGTLLTTNHFYAGSSGRRVLSRIELSSDRRRATLFYLEPLPGGAFISAVFNGTGLTDVLGRPLDADGDGHAGGTALIGFRTLSLAPLTNTAVIGRVFASEQLQGTNATNFINRPLAGVTITVDGMEETLRTKTDAMGNFKLEPVPPGKFFVHIDGRTVTNLAEGIRYPDLSYYPFVGKEWEAVAGRTDTLAGGNGQIFLPLIVQGTLQTVSMTNDTTIGFPPAVLIKNPELAGVTVTVPANSLFSDDGTRGGRVGIAPVPPDRLPGPLPPGVSFPLVITVQTDGGANFDRPVPVRFLNLPDPLTGVRLPPGARTALWSFNHDTGRWEIQGPMTVTEDGNFVESDPGVGIRQPGWHGTRPGVGAGGGPPPPVPPDPDCPNPTPKPDWNPNDHFNGCGPEGLDFLVPDLYFFDACKNHDIGYSTCNKPKNDSDDQFLNDMLRTCAGISDPVERVKCTALAHVYHKAVSDGGGGAYKDAQADACDCNSPPPPGGPEGKSMVAKANKAATHVAAGLVYFAIINEQTHEVVVRGTFVGTPPAAGTIFLAANTLYRYAVVEAATLFEGSAIFMTPGNGSNIQLPQVLLYDPRSWDLDGDALHDLSELVVGTDMNQADSDGDGVSDGAEVRQGTNPLDGRPAQTGIVATARTLGTAVDICTVNDLAVLAEMDRGVSVFNIFNGMNPVRIAQVDTPGVAQRVACAGNLIAVADGAAGLAVIDITDPPAAHIIHQVTLEGLAQAVATAGGLAYVGLSSGQIVTVDLASGTILQQTPAAGSIQDLGLGSEFLYVLTTDRLHTFSIQDGDLAFTTTVNSPVFATGNRRLFVGDRFAYATQNKGVNTFSLTNPAAPVLLNAANTTQFGWKQFVPNGSGLALAADDPNFALDGPNDISLYDLSNPTNTQTLLTRFPTPGIAYAVSIFNGLGYVADGAAGLQVVNYLAYDNRGTNPAISLSASFPLFSGLAEEGKQARVTVAVTDDVQVRNVEFYVDGVKVLTDGNFPFEHRFVTRAISAVKSNFTVRACAFDTGGNSACTPTYTVMLVPDATAPRVGRTFPSANTVSTSAPTVFVYFTEPIDLSTLHSGSLGLTFAGADNKLDTTDDAAAGGSISWRDTLNAATLSFATPLPLGLYRGTVTAGIRDVAGNSLQAAFHWSFWILPGGAGGDEDDDGLSNTNEIGRGTNPFIADSDGDGWTDGVEVADGFDPLGANSAPRMHFVGKPTVDVLFSASAEAGTNTSGVIVGRPPIEVFFPEGDAGGLRPGVTVGRPPIDILFPDLDAESPGGTIIGRPPVEILLPVLDEDGRAATSVTLGRPPLLIRFVP